MHLRKIIKLIRRQPFGIDQKWLAENRASLRAYLAQNPAALTKFSRGRGGFFAPIFSPSFSRAMLAVGAIIFFLASGGAVAAAQGALPGETLYPLKLASERAREIAAVSSEKKIKLKMKFTSRRINETQKILDKFADKEDDDFKDAQIMLNEARNSLRAARDFAKNGERVKAFFEAQKSVRAVAEIKMKVKKELKNHKRSSDENEKSERRQKR